MTLSRLVRWKLTRLAFLKIAVSVLLTEFCIIDILTHPKCMASEAHPPEDDEPATLVPGLVAVYQDVGKSRAAEIVRVEPSIAFSLGPDESPHPKIDSRAWTGEWTGQIQVHRGGAFRFSARLIGNLRVTVGDREAFNSDVTTEQPEIIQGSSVELTAGLHPLRVKFSKVDGPARAQILWESAAFSREPLPWLVLSHRPDQMPPMLERTRLQDHGRFQFEELSCIACHRAGEENALARNLERREGPDLSRAGERMYAGWIYRWLEDPQAFRPQPVMPRMFAEDERGILLRRAVTEFLASLGGPLRPPQKEPKQDDLRNSRKRGERIFGRVGCTVCHSTTDGKTTTATLTHLGSKTIPDRLAQFLQNPLAVDPSGRMPNMMLNGNEARDVSNLLCESVDERIEFELPPRPDAEAVRSAFRKLDVDNKELDAFEKLAPAQQLISLGRRAVVALGCTNCHRIAPGGQPLPTLESAPEFDAMRHPTKLARGCLRSGSGNGTVGLPAPRFAITPEQRESLNAFLTEASDGPGAPAPAFQVFATLQRFQCLGCHSRNGRGGLSPQIVEELRNFETAQDAEAIHPPPLTEVGAKLRTAWLREVIVNGRRARPWMVLRMPQFGSANVGRLPEQLAACDGTEPSDAIHQFVYDADHIKAGRFLVGKKGFGCISCHDLAGRPNTGTRGPDLALMNQRVRFDWYRRWLDDPQRMQPGTRMPTVFQNGTTAIKTVLDGRGTAQSDAIWEYLSLGANLPLPEGLEPTKGLVVEPQNRPIVVRTFMPDAGSRAFAIGFPGRLSFAYDAARCRLAYGWTGDFIEASPIWHNRGGNPAGIQGPRFWNAPAGFPWSFSDSPGEAGPNWIAQQSDPAFGAAMPEGQLFDGSPKLQFRNLTISKESVPSFRYAIDVGENGQAGKFVEIREQIEPRQELAGVGVVRHFEVRSPAGLSSRLLVGQGLQPPQFLDNRGEAVPWDATQGIAEQTAGGHHILLSGGPTGANLVSLIAGPDETKWSLRNDANQWFATLQVPLQDNAKPVKISVCIWSPYRTEPAMIRALLERQSGK